MGTVWFSGVVIGRQTPENQNSVGKSQKVAERGEDCKRPDSARIAQFLASHRESQPLKNDIWIMAIGTAIIQIPPLAHTSKAVQKW